MAKVEGLADLNRKLARMAAQQGSGKISCTVGYTQSYALYVHENLNASHPTGQAKFLEEPARTKAREIGKAIADEVANGRTLRQAILLGGLMLQRESQLLVPVDTGALKNSAFTRLE